MVESFISLVGVWLRRCDRGSLVFLAWPSTACSQVVLRWVGVTMEWTPVFPDWRVLSGGSSACLPPLEGVFLGRTGMSPDWRGNAEFRADGCKMYPNLATCCKALGYVRFSSGEMTTDSERCPLDYFVVSFQHLIIKLRWCLSLMALQYGMWILWQWIISSSMSLISETPCVGDWITPPGTVLRRVRLSACLHTDVLSPWLAWRNWLAIRLCQGNLS